MSCARSSLGLAVALLAGSLACALPPPAYPTRDLEGWHTVTTRETRLVGDVPPEQLEQLAGELARFAAASELVLNLPDTPPRVPLTLLVFDDRELLREFAQARWIQGQIFSLLEGYYSYLGDSATHVGTRSTLFHEYVHFLLRRQRSYEYPRWFHEGMAEYLSTLRFRDDAVIVGTPPTHRIGTISRGDVAAPADLFVPNVGVSDFYASSWLYAHLLFSEADLRPKLAAFDRRLASGEDPLPAAEATFGPDLDAFRERARFHHQRLVKGARRDFVFPVERLDVAPIASPEAVPPAEVGYALGFVMLRLGDVDPERRRFAQRFFAGALAVDPDSPHANAGLAEARAREGRSEEARARIRRAVAAGEPDHRVRLHAARVFAHLAEAAEAEAAEAEWHSSETWARSALREEPGSPAAWAALGRAQRAQGRLADARNSLEAARSHGASSALLDIELAEIAIEQDRVADARVLLQPLAFPSHHHGLAERARELLEELERGTPPARP